MTLTIHDRRTRHRCNEPAAATVIAAALRASGTATVTHSADPTGTRWQFAHRNGHVVADALNPDLFADPNPPAWATRLTVAIARLI